jgi:hypothetical protein
MKKHHYFVTHVRNCNGSSVIYFPIRYPCRPVVSVYLYMRVSKYLPQGAKCFFSHIKLPFKKGLYGWANFENHHLPCIGAVHVTSTAMCYWSTRGRLSTLPHHMSHSGRTWSYSEMFLPSQCFCGLNCKYKRSGISILHYRDSYLSAQCRRQRALELVQCGRCIAIGATLSQSLCTEIAPARRIAVLSPVSSSFGGVVSLSYWSDCISLQNLLQMSRLYGVTIPVPVSEHNVSARAVGPGSYLYRFADPPGDAPQSLKLIMSHLLSSQLFKNI